MTLSDRIAVLEKLGEHLLGKDEYLEAVMARSKYHNGWFTIESQQEAISAIANQFLNKSKLQEWVAKYRISDQTEQKVLGLVLAGNLPLVGFHDILTVFLSGHKAQVKLSDKDKYLLPYFVKLLNQFNPQTGDYFEFVDNLGGFDAIIATGSNNSARYFEAYFGTYPNIIRRNRNGVAVLTGEEAKGELSLLGKDVFQFFGLGCRNVSKIYVPRGYDFDPLLEALHEFKKIVLNTKYKNNFDHNYALLILNKTPYKANGCILMTENDSFQSPIACLHYSYYDSKEQLQEELMQRKEEIQCIVSKEKFEALPSFDFGQAQEPGLADYADGVDTMEFLINLS